MSRPVPAWGRLWASLPLSYKLVALGLMSVMVVAGAIMVVTYRSANDSLTIQFERQLSRDLNVAEQWYRTRFEEIQLTASSAVRQPELARALAAGLLTPEAAALLLAEKARLQLDQAELVDASGRPLGPAGPGPRLDPDGLVARSLRSKAPQIATIAFTDDGQTPDAWPRAGLNRVVVTPVAGGRGALLLSEWMGPGTALPHQMTALYGGVLAVLDRERVIAAAGVQPGALRFEPGVWEGVREGRVFFTEVLLGRKPYLVAFRPLTGADGQPVGALARAFPEAEISEALSRYAGGILLITAAAVALALGAFFALTRGLLFPITRLARLAAELAEPGGQAGRQPRSRDEVRRLEEGVERLAERLTQNRLELAEAAVKLEVEADALAERNRELARLDAEKAVLLAQVRAHDALRGRLLTKVITAQEDERKRLSRELHDETGQSLTGLLVGLKVLEAAPSLEVARERVAGLKALTSQTLQAVHSLSVALRPPALDDLGLTIALRSLVAEFGEQHGVDAALEASALDGRLPAAHEVALYRFVQEALTNVAKHAGATRVTVGLAAAGGELAVEIADDGAGFEPARLDPASREHLGLLGMEERVALLGGRFEILSAPGAGTRVRARLPLPAHAPEGVELV